MIDTRALSIGQMSASADWQAIAVAEVELSQPLRLVCPVPGREVADYQRALVLVRLHGHPLGALALDPSAVADGSDLAEAIWAQLAEPIVAHATADGMPTPSRIDRDGLRGEPAACRAVEGLLPSASIVIATRNRPDKLALCLDTLLALDHQALEIIVVENVRTDDRTENAVLERSMQHPGLRYLCEDRPGIAPARNRGLAEATGEVVVFTDDDVLLDRGWLGSLLRRFGDGVSCVTALVMPAELETEAQLRFEQFGGFSKGFERRVFDATRPRGTTTLYPYVSGVFGSGATIAIEAALFRRLGGFDPALGSALVGVEDIDTFTRVILSGARIAYEPAAVAWHFHRRSLDGLKRQLRSYGRGLGAVGTKWLLHDRTSARRVLTGLPGVVRLVVDPRSPKNRNKASGYPSGLNRAEWRGLVSGPVAYARSRRMARTMEGGGHGAAASPLLRNAHALLVNTGGTALLGVLYWMIAARLYAPEAVGLGSATISTMLMLSGFAQLNLMGVLTRFLPVAGRRGRALVAWSYGTSAATALVISSGFLLVARRVAGPGGPLDPPAAQAAWLAVSVVAWSIFTLQDSVLTGLRQSIWVPVENLTFGVVKIVVLVALAPLSPGFGIFASFTVPTLISLVPVNWLIFRRLLPQGRATDPAASPAATIPPVAGRVMARFAAADFLGGVPSYANLALLPLLVVAHLGAAANAHLYVGWIVKISFDAMAQSVATSLTVEGAHDESRLGEFVAAIARRTAAFVVPVALGLCLSAHWVLSLFGGRYAAEGTNVLRLLALSAIPGAVPYIYAGAERVRRRLGRIVVVRATECLGMLAFTAALIPRIGLIGVGVAVLAARTVVAAAILPAMVRLVRTDPDESRTCTGGAGAEDGPMRRVASASGPSR